MVETNPSQRFLESLAVRDFEGLVGVLAPQVRARMLLPRGLEELSGRELIVERFRGWFASVSRFEAVSAGSEAIGARHRLSWSLRVVRDSGSPELVEQHAVVDLGPVKGRVFAEAARVLRPGGRLAIADIVSGRPFEDGIRRNVELWAACIAGAIPGRTYLAAVSAAGFDVIEVRRNDHRFISERALSACSHYTVESISFAALRRPSG